jgi:hypothetical protein
MTNPQPFVTQGSTVDPQRPDIASLTPILGEDVPGSDYLGRVVVELWRVPAASTSDGLHFATFGSFGRGSHVPVELMSDLATRIGRRVAKLGK